MIILIIALVILIPIIWGILVYNKLIKDRLKVDNQWSQIDVQLKEFLLFLFLPLHLIVHNIFLFFRKHTFCFSCLFFAVVLQ